jgi:hypothetical protein
MATTHVHEWRTSSLTHLDLDLALHPPPRVGRSTWWEGGVRHGGGVQWRWRRDAATAAGEVEWEIEREHRRGEERRGDGGNGREREER